MSGEGKEKRKRCGGIGVEKGEVWGKGGEWKGREGWGGLEKTRGRRMMRRGNVKRSGKGGEGR